MIAENCWKFMKCSNAMKQNCDVYLHGYGKECWLIPKGVMKGCPSTPKKPVPNVLGTIRITTVMNKSFDLSKRYP